MKYYILMIFTCFIASFVKADIELVSQLDFGTIAILDNSQVETYRLYDDGRVRTTDNILIVKAGSPAVIRVFDLAPNTPIVVTNLITDNTFRSGEPGTNTLELTELSSSILLNTDEAGEVIFSLGGTLVTNGNSTLQYGNSFLLARFNVTIDY